MADACYYLLSVGIGVSVLVAVQEVFIWVRGVE